jgi:hypothetical protein
MQPGQEEVPGLHSGFQNFFPGYCEKGSVCGMAGGKTCEGMIGFPDFPVYPAYRRFEPATIWTL